jgi:hypothetical protein
MITGMSHWCQAHFQLFSVEMGSMKLSSPNAVLPFSPSQVARIIGVSHLCPAYPCHFTGRTPSFSSRVTDEPGQTFSPVADPTNLFSSQKDVDNSHTPNPESFEKKKVLEMAVIPGGWAGSWDPNSYPHSTHARLS